MSTQRNYNSLGRAMEATPIEYFKEDFVKQHRNVKITACGLFLCEDIPFVGGSPDSIVSCDCCGRACNEVKCPFSMRNTTPYDPKVKLPYFKQVDGTFSINEAHRYFTQCQIQMAATKNTLEQAVDHQYLQPRQLWHTFYPENLF